MSYHRRLTPAPAPDFLADPRDLPGRGPTGTAGYLETRAGPDNPIRKIPDPAAARMSVAPRRATAGRTARATDGRVERSNPSSSMSDVASPPKRKWHETRPEKPCRGSGWPDPGRPWPYMTIPTPLQSRTEESPPGDRG